MSATLTYTSLVTDVLAYCERTDDALLAAQMPRCVMLAETRIATDLKIEGTSKVVSGSFTPLDPTLPKPAYWKNTVSFQVTLANGKRISLLPRFYEYCTGFWPDRTKTDNPRFYADYDADHYFIAPTPATALPFELDYHCRVDPLDAANTTNWLTANVPQLLFQATMVEAQTYLKNKDGMATWETRYQDSLGGLKTENAGHAVDRTTVPS